MHSFLQSFRLFLQRDGATLLPEMELLLFAVGILLIDRWLEEKEKHWSALLALSGVGFSAFTLWTLRAQVSAGEGVFGFRQSILIDSFYLFFAALLLAATFLTILASQKSIQLTPARSARFYALILLAAAGMLLMISGSNLLVLFFAVEIVSLSFWLLEAPAANNAFTGRPLWLSALFAALSSVPLVAGFALLYGLSGATNIGSIGLAFTQRSDIARAIAISQQPGSRGEEMRQILAARMPEALQHHWLPMEALPVCALLLIALGILGKTARLALLKGPLEGNRTVATAIRFYAIVAGAVMSIALLLRLLLTVFASSQESWLYWIASIALLGLVASSFRRSVELSKFLALGCFSQFFFLLLGVVSANDRGIVGMAFYMLVYVFMAAGAFTVLLLLSRSESPAEGVADGLYQRNAPAALLLLVFLASLAGIPLTGGFLAKYYILKSLIETRHFAIAIFAAVCLLPMLYACLRTAMRIFRKPAIQTEPLPMSNGEAIALGACLFVTLATGLYAEPFLRLARYAFGQ